MKKQFITFPIWMALTYFILLSTYSASSNSQLTDELVVSSTRLTQSQTAASVTIITSEEIVNSLSDDLPQLLGLQPGIHSRDLFSGTNGTEATVDMRGFGAVGTQNTLVLLDGRRLNDVDLAAVDFSNLPLKNIAYIEIIRCHAGSVLYGDGAVGGVINIVTKSPTSYQDSAETGYSFSHPGQTHTVNMSAKQSAGRYSINAATNFIHGEGFRDNNNLIQKNLVTQLRYTGDTNEIFLKLGTDFQSVGLPGARQINRAAGTNQFTDSPEEAASLIDKALQRGLRVDIGVTSQLPNDNTFVLDAGFRSKDQDSRVFSIVDTVLTTISVTPRADIFWGRNGRLNATKIGLDLYHSNYDSDRKQDPGDPYFHRYNAYQSALGIYSQNEVALLDSLILTAGLRLSWVGFTAGDEIDNGAPGGGFETDHDSTRRTERNYVYNLGLGYQMSEKISGFARTSRAIRLPTIDERIGSSDTNTFKLNTQTSNDLELGLSYTAPKYHAALSGFLMKLTNELRFDPTLGGGFGLNENTDPTKRVGAELNTSYALSPSITLSAYSSIVKATYRQGIFSGNIVPLVPQWQFGGTADWNIVPSLLNAKLNAHYVDQARLDNDESNEGEQIPAYYLFDFGLYGNIGPSIYGASKWSVEISNVLGHKYYNYGVRSTTNTRVSNVYPLSGRVARVGLTWQF